jgi:DNA-binding NtrC family response regulator
MIARVLEEVEGRKGDAAQRLGLPRRTLFDKIKRYRIDGS